MSGRLSQLPTRGIPARLVKTLARIAGDFGAGVPVYPMLVLETATTKPWSSATFDGEIHRLELRLHGGAVEIGNALDRLIDRLPDAEFDLSGQFVADAKLLAFNLNPEPGVAVLSLIVEVMTVID